MRCSGYGHGVDNYHFSILLPFRYTTIPIYYQIPRGCEAQISLKKTTQLITCVMAVFHVVRAIHEVTCNTVKK